MYVKTTITLQDLQGNEDVYEVGADVEPSLMHDGVRDRFTGYYDVGDPDFSAPDGELASSSIARDPQGGGVFPTGWSDAVEEALVSAYQATCEDGDDEGPDPDEYDDIYADRDDGDYMYGED